MDQDRQDLKRAFALFQAALTELDQALQRAWSKAAHRVLMADAPGTLKKVYVHVAQGATILSEVSRRSPALEDLFGVNYRAATAAVAALAGRQPRGPSSPQALRALGSACAEGHSRLRSLLAEMETEYGRLAAWAKAIEKKRPQEVRLEFPPMWVLLERAKRRDDPVPPDVEVFDPDILEEADLFEEEEKQEPSLASEEELALERDMRMLDELESLLRPHREVLADPTTAAFLSIRDAPDGATTTSGD